MNNNFSFYYPSSTSLNDMMPGFDNCKNAIQKLNMLYEFKKTLSPKTSAQNIEAEIDSYIKNEEEEHAISKTKNRFGNNAPLNINELRIFKREIINSNNLVNEKINAEIIFWKKKMELENTQELTSQKSEVPQRSQIKWNSSCFHFGYIINELINKGYFDNLPISNGETNYSEIAKIFGSIIDFNTTEQYLLKSFNPYSEKISETVKNKFKIPPCEDIKPKNLSTKVVKNTPSIPIKLKKKK